ncbi:MAG: S41 family peptidase [Bacteroidetes bacterium]|nr:S41 family peptidase [Bacteroidota bacterium]
MKKENKGLLYVFIAFILVGFLGYSVGVMKERREITGVVTSFNKFFKSQPINTNLQNIIRLVQKNYVDSVDMDSISEKMIPLLLKELDPHSSYIPARLAKQTQEDLQGNFDGIGVMFNMLTDTVIIQDVISGGPSSKVGLITGDRIIKINDSIVAGRKINSKNIVKKLKGKGGTQVKVGVKRFGVDSLIDISITRGKVLIKSIDASFMIRPKVGYVKLLRFSRDTHAELVKAISSLKEKGMEHLILDLQNNGGGYLDQAILIANEFLPADKMIVYTEGRGERLSEQYSDGNGRFIDEDVTILINEASASASEIVSGALQDNDIGEIIGRRSFGKGLVQQQMDLRDGSILLLTIARYYTPTGRCIQRPYVGGDQEKYYKDYFARFEHGEMLSRDSIKQNDSLRYVTPKGKIVYGGGGIMPDIFVPMDTTSYSQFERKALTSLFRIRYASQYTDKHRRELEDISNKQDLDKYFDKNMSSIMRGYKKYFFKSEKDGGTAKEWKRIDEDLIKLFKATIGDATQLKTNAFYIYMADYDQIIMKAINVTENKDIAKR